jgi:hypothetical protein
MNVKVGNVEIIGSGYRSGYRDFSLIAHGGQIFIDDQTIPDLRQALDQYENALAARQNTEGPWKITPVRDHHKLWFNTLPGRDTYSMPVTFRDSDLKDLFTLLKRRFG